MIAPLLRMAANPIVRPRDIVFTDASGAFNPGACIDHRSGRVVLLVRVYERATLRSCLALATSADGEHFEYPFGFPIVGRDMPYEAWGVEDARITWLAAEGRYAITYTGYSAAGPRVCLITTDNLLDPARYVRHGPRIAGENKNCVVFPERVGGQYVVFHRPMPNIVCVRVAALDDIWPAAGVHVLGPEANTWRSARVGAGAPPILTRLGWLLPFHGATTIAEGNVYSMGWCVLAADDPARALWVSDQPALQPEAPYEIEPGPIPQVDMANFITGVRVVFPQGMVELGSDLVVYYGAADVSVAAARVEKEALLTSIERAMVSS